MTHNSFTIIDIKTAEDEASIRQVGIVKYIDSKMVSKYTTRVDPDGADGVPTFEDVAQHIFKSLHGEIVVAYGRTPRLAIETAFGRAGLDVPEVKWVDCRHIALAAWTDLEFGVQLPDVCELIGFEYCPQDPQETAQAIGSVFLAALRAVSD